MWSIYPTSLLLEYTACNHYYLVSISKMSILITISIFLSFSVGWRASYPRWVTLSPTLAVCSYSLVNYFCWCFQMLVQRLVNYCHWGSISTSFIWIRIFLTFHLELGGVKIAQMGYLAPQCLINYIFCFLLLLVYITSELLLLA